MRNFCAFAVSRAPYPVAALVAAVLWSAGCGGAGESTASQQPVADGGRDARTTTTSTTTTAPPGAPAEPETLGLDHPDGAYSLIWVRRGAQVEIRTEPDGGRVVEVVDKRTEFGSPTVYGVVKQAGEWVGVTTPFLPNGRLGWIRLDPDRLRAGWTKYALQVDLSERRAALHDGEKIARTFAVTVGAPGYDTPTGRFSVSDTFRGDLDPGSYGCCALALTATQPVVPSGWLGGNRIAIHGTSGALGVAASHGCIRAADPDVDELVDRVPLGTPVFIRA